MQHFPNPVKLGRATTRWREADLLRWEAAASERPIEIPAEAEHRYLRDVEVATRYGIARQTVWRWVPRASADRAA